LRSVARCVMAAAATLAAAPVRAKLTLPLPMRQQPPPEEFGDYTRGGELGSGGFGCVFSCRRHGDVREVAGSGCAEDEEALAVKVIDLRRLRLSNNAERSFQNLRREAEILRNLPKHPNVVRMVDSVEAEHWFFLVLELVRGGDLLEALVRQAKRCLASEEVAFILRQLVEGLSFLHGRGIVHRDLKPENVLVASADRRGAVTLYRVKITDFGLSKVIAVSEARSVVGTRSYIAPEVLSGGAYDYRVDLWSLGVLLYLLLDGRFPHECPAQAAQAALDAAASRLRAGKQVQALVARLLRLDPQGRLSLQGLAEHTWLQDGAATAEAAEAATDAPPTPIAAEAFEVSSRLSSSVLSLGSADFSVLAMPPLPPGAPAHSMASSAAAARAVVAGPCPATPDIQLDAAVAEPSLSLWSSELDSPRESKRARIVA